MQPWMLLVAALAACFNHTLQAVIEYLIEENRTLKAQLGRRRPRLTDDQRRRLAVKGKKLGRKLLAEVATLVTPDTILRWHRQLVALKWNLADRRMKAGHPPVDKERAELVVRLAKENPSWGYDRIVGALKELGHTLSDQTVGNILKEYGLEPAPQRRKKGNWHTFLKAHWDVIAAVDFTTVEVWTKGGLMTFYLLFLMELKTRRVHFAGCTTQPTESYMMQIARNVTDAEDGFLLGKRYLIMDRDTKFSAAFRELPHCVGVEPVVLPPRSPNLNAHLERFVRLIKEECLERMIFFGERSLRNAVSQYLEHYHTERTHQRLDNKRIEPVDEEVNRDMSLPIHCRERLGGITAGRPDADFTAKSLSWLVPVCADHGHSVVRSVLPCVPATHNLRSDP